MTFKRRQVQFVAGALAATMLIALPLPTFAAKPASSAYSTIQLKATPQKEVVYYNNSAIIPDIDWVTDSTALTFLPTAVTGDVTSVVKEESGVLWIGTETGLQRVNFSAEDPGDIVEYFAGPRYLYGGDNNVTGLASDGEGGIWAKTASGVTHITMKEKTLVEKATRFEELADLVNDRRGMKTGTSFTFTDSANPGIVDYSSPTGVFTSAPETDDNDGLWTSMYAIGEIFRYATLVEEYGESPSDPSQAAEIEAAQDSAVHATKAVLLLDYVSGRGNGFPARSYMLTSEPNAATVGGTVYGYQSQNGFWFQNFVGEDAVNPNGIIPSMKIEGADPIGYSMVRVTKDATNKSGSNVFSSIGNDNVMAFNGFGLNPEAIEELNKTRPDGQKLGTDIYVTVKEYPQVLPVITAATNQKKPAEDKTTSESNKPLFQLTAPIYEQIPTIFNDLFPSSALKEVDGQQVIDMNQIVYKADTSSDEVIGHYALFFTAYKYLIGNSQDSELLELKPYVVDTTKRMTDLILKDDHYYIEDATGKSTQWSRWFSEYFNDNLDEMKSQPEWSQYKLGLVGEDGDKEDGLSYGFEDAPLNALELMSVLKTATTVTAADYPANSAKYQLAYEQTYDSSYSTSAEYINGKGYINMALEYIERRLVRQANDAYGVNDDQPVTRDNYQYSTEDEADDRIHDNATVNGTLHGDWTQYLNYSDEELAWFALYPLILQETDATKHSLIAQAFDQWYENEQREENPFYTFLYQLAHPERTDIDLEAAVDYLYSIPQYQVTFQIEWNRQDVLYIEPGFRDDYVQTNYVLPMDERRAMKNNGNPFEAEKQAGAADPNYGYNGSGLDLEVGSTFSVPYWMGRYFEIIKE
ncbi:hypothetical protein [Cohnella fermenti]|uniref:Copper amine oxidase-like N-terminal domain-containing protein n=1 Tax=Cohnella fermenti TaxID=2565925 RepID=A0A4S4C953_9BACL|nr:hypothetical protein [Cohnella fermenti]THF84230.1 hypothetical protein E6C55_02760 [Cohnella fermenti]